MRVKTLTAQTSNPRKSQLSRRVSTEGSHPAFRSKVVTLQRETTMVAKPTHTLQRVWRPISYASTTVLEQTWQLEPKATGCVVSVPGEEEGKSHRTKLYFLGYKSCTRPSSIDLAVAIHGFGIDNIAAQTAIHGSKALHARRWQTKDGTYPLVASRYRYIPNTLGRKRSR